MELFAIFVTTNKGNNLKHIKNITIMSRETLTTKAIEMVILELIGQGITTKEALIEAMKREDVQNSVKMAIEVLEKEFN